MISHSLLSSLKNFFQDLDSGDWIQVFIGIIALFGPYIFEIWKSRFYRPKLKLSFSRKQFTNCLIEKQVGIIISNKKGKENLTEPEAYVSYIEKKKEGRFNVGQGRWYKPDFGFRPYRLGWINKDDYRPLSIKEIKQYDWDYLWLFSFHNKVDTQKIFFSKSDNPYDHRIELQGTSTSLPDMYYLDPGDYRILLTIIGNHSFKQEYIIKLHWDARFDEINSNPDPDLFNIKIRKKYIWDDVMIN